jgi:hypothetical protein
MGNEIKGNGKFRARLNASGYKQENGVRNREDDKAALVSNDTTIRIMKAHVVDVQGAFLNGRFSENEELYLKIPEGWEDLKDATKKIKC